MNYLIDSLIQIFYKLLYKVVLCLWFFTRPTINGVFIGVWHKGKVLVIKNSYRKWYIVPCGGIRRKETLEIAAVRELFEEVGIKVEIGQIRFVGTYADRYKYALDTGHFYEFESSTMPEIRIDNREVVWAGFMRPEDAEALELNPLVRMYLQSRSSELP